MALPSGTFSRSVNGPLQITFTGEFSVPGGTYWNPAGSGEIWLSGTVTDGTTTRKVRINPASPTAVVDWDYVAGTTLTCSMSVDYYNVFGIDPVSATKLRIRGIFMKR